MKHVVRALALFVLILVAFIGGIFVLNSLGEEVYPGYADRLMGISGNYGMDRNQKELLNEPKYTGKEYCRDCHQKEFELSEKGGHKFDCETCHGYGKGHPPKDMGVENTREFCLNCHKPVLGRPDYRLLEDWESHGYPDQPCTVCHDPHYPWFG